MQWYCLSNWTNFTSECKAGYYGNGTNCVMCSGHTIKAMAGNTPNCDTTCDSTTEVPNDSHTACGMCFLYLCLFRTEKQISSFSI